MEEPTNYHPITDEIRDGHPAAYRDFFENNSSVLKELVRSWTDGHYEQTNQKLTTLSRWYRKIHKQLNAQTYTIEFEAGRLCGIIEAFDGLYQYELEIRQIDAAMADYLSQSKPSSRHVLCILFEASVDDSWVPNATLEKDCSLSRSSLSNIMKRLVQAKAVEFYKEGRTVSYRLTSSGKRYYQKNILSTAKRDSSSDLHQMNEKLDLLANEVTGVKEILKNQYASITRIERNLPFIKQTYAHAMENNFLPVPPETRELADLKTINRFFGRSDDFLFNSSL
jgi:predicted transcriptional regulator